MVGSYPSEVGKLYFWSLQSLIGSSLTQLDCAQLGSSILRVPLHSFTNQRLENLISEAFKTWLDQVSPIWIALWTTQDLELTSLGRSILRLPLNSFTHQRSENSTFEAFQTWLDPVSHIWIALLDDSRAGDCQLGVFYFMVALEWLYSSEVRKFNLCRRQNPIGSSLTRLDCALDHSKAGDYQLGSF